MPEIFIARVLDAFGFHFETEFPHLRDDHDEDALNLDPDLQDFGFDQQPLHPMEI